MSGLVTLPSERLQTIAMLQDTELSVWAYAKKSVSGPRRTVYESKGTFVGLAKQMTGSLYFFHFNFANLFCTFLTIKKTVPPFIPPLLLAIISLPPTFPCFVLLLFPPTEAVPMLVIVGGAVGGGCVLLICIITLVSLCCRHTGKGELNGQYGQKGKKPLFSF